MKPWRPNPAEQLVTDFDLEPKLQSALAAAWDCQEFGDGDEAEGHPLHSRSPSPLTPSADEEIYDFSSSTTPADLAYEKHGLFSISPLSSRSNSPTPMPNSVVVTGDNPATHLDLLSMSEMRVGSASCKQPGIERRRKNDAAKKRKKGKRQTEAMMSPLDRPLHRKVSSAKYIIRASRVLTKFDANNLSHSSTGYIGARTRTKSHPVDEDALLAAGARNFPWDGRTPTLVTDRNDRILLNLIGRPEDADWDDVGRRSHFKLQRFRMIVIALGIFRYYKHRRGGFLAVTSGFSFGGGQVRPGNLAHSHRARRLLQMLLTDSDIRRIVGFQSAALGTYAPKVFEHMRDMLAKLCAHDPRLKMNFSNSVFPAVTFNCGPQTECLLHEDFGNAPYFFCAITALGHFNHRQSAKFVAADLGLIIEFPSCSTIAVPSASLTHGNTGMLAGETRSSITQFCAGGLIRYVEYGFRTVKDLLSEPNGKIERAQIDGPPGSRWLRSLDFFSKAGELLIDYERVFGQGRNSGE